MAAPSPPDEEPLPVRFASAMAALDLTPGTASAARPLVVAVSGGGDSVALLHLARRWCRAPRDLLALTVDHGLRPAAAAEAAWVAARCARLGVPHRILRADMRLPSGGLQAAARSLRYRLLAEAAAATGAGRLLLAHTLDDQAETVLMRRRRGSGPAGLAGMAPAVRRHDLPAAPLVLRPLLRISGAALRHWLRGEGEDWIEDPSNDDPRFERVRLRRMLQARAAAGRSRAGASPAAPALVLRLARDAARMRRVADRLDMAADEALAAALTLSPHGFERLAPAALRAVPPEVALHALRRLLAASASEGYPPRRAAVARLWQSLQDGSPGATLAGWRLQRDAAAADSGYFLLRDLRHALPPLDLVPGMRTDWAGRYRVAVAAETPPGLSLRELGGIGLRRVARAVAGGAALAEVPAPVRPVVPAVFAGPTLVALPSLDCGPAGARPVLERLRWRCLPAPSGSGDVLPQANRAAVGERPLRSACSEARGVLSTGVPAVPDGRAAPGPGVEIADPGVGTIAGRAWPAASVQAAVCPDAADSASAGRRDRDQFIG